MKYRHHLALLAVVSVSLSLVTVMPALAEGGSGSTSGSSGSGSGSDSKMATTEQHNTSSGTETTHTIATVPPVTHEGSGTADDSAHQTEPASSVGDDRMKLSKINQTELNDLHKHASELLAAARKNHKQLTAEERQKACLAHQHEIISKTENFGANALKHFITFNGVLAKVQAYYTDKHLTVAGYDALLATTQTKGAAATAAINVLSSLNTEFDCSGSDPAQGVANVKAAVANSRMTLQAYRSSIRAVITLLKSMVDVAHNASGENQ